MDRLFEATFYFGIGMLAIVVTVYVLAVSLLGKAIKISIKDTKDIEEKKKTEVHEAIANLNKQKERMEHDFDQTIKAELKEWKKQRRINDRKLFWIKVKPLLLTSYGVFVPGLFFIIVISLSAWERYQIQVNQTNHVSYLISILLSLAVGILFLGLILKAVEEIAIVSEETALTRQKEMQIEAMREYDQSKKPALVTEWIGNKMPPFNFNPGAIVNIGIGIRLLKGECAENTFMQIYLPPNFSFPNQGVFIQPPSEPIVAGFDTFRVDFGTVLLGMTYGQQIPIKTSIKSGKYNGYTEIHCKEFAGALVPFEINIVPSDSGMY